MINLELKGMSSTRWTAKEGEKNIIVTFMDGLISLHREWAFRYFVQLFPEVLVLF